jgi:hypothetical protein
MAERVWLNRQVVLVSKGPKLCFLVLYHVHSCSKCDLVLRDISYLPNSVHSQVHLQDTAPSLLPVSYLHATALIGVSLTVFLFLTYTLLFILMD